MIDKQAYKSLSKEKSKFKTSDDLPAWIYEEKTPKFDTLEEFGAWLDEEEKNYVEDMSPECRENWDMKMDDLGPESGGLATFTRSQIMEYIKKGSMTEDYLIDGLYCHVIEDDEKDK